MTNIHQAHCDCISVKISMIGEPKVHAYCHCADCRELLQVPFHSVLAFEAENVKITQGENNVVEFQHPCKKMKRIFCKHCGDVLYNTNSMGWRLVSQLLFRKCNNNNLPEAYSSDKHIFYDRRIIDIDDPLPKH